MKLIYKFFLFLLVIGLLSCTSKTLFQNISSDHSGVHFKNEIIENDTINPLDLVNIYNGGGVGIGDFNNDGLQDIYFSGNRVSNKLYLNKGNFVFQDITDIAGVGGLGRWSRGVSIVDINNDGLMDIYVCNTIYGDSVKRKNLLYINQGPNKDGIPIFKEEAKEYGLDAGTFSTMASFFDFDNDGDLDMYLTVNNASSSYNPSIFGPVNSREKQNIGGRLYRNDYNETLHHPVFTDISDKAGINLSGFGHSATTVDMNGDGWKDIYISNDFISSNVLFINNKNGTFTDHTKEYFKHTSLNSMGQDIVDINNDGLPDVVELDMNPEDNYRKKMMLGPNSYNTYRSFDFFGNQYQYVRNTLQINQGFRVEEQDKIGSPIFSEIGYLSGIAQTDWSWTPLIIDFNNDGFRDLVITNGFEKDVSDRDFMTYRKEAYAITSKEKVLEQVPQIKLHNYAFQNNGDLKFKDMTKEWGLTLPTFSNGAAYVDLDNDGAMDMVINNINDEALIYRNTSRDNPETHNKTHYLQIDFKGGKQNIKGIGATAYIYYDHNKKQVYENDPYRGYISTDQCIAHFGLGNVSLIDSAVILWPGGKKQIIQNIKVDQKIKVKFDDAKEIFPFSIPKYAKNTLFKEVSDTLGLHFKNKEPDFVDFNIQKLLPHKLSEYSPALAVGDLNGDGLDDLVMGGNANDEAQLFFQLANGKFQRRDLLSQKNDPLMNFKDAGILVFDVNGDGFQDIYMASGSNVSAPNSPDYQDRLYINDGKGNFKEEPNAIPKNYISKLCVRSFDYNKDGKPDLIISGRLEPWHYPKPVSCTILRNDTKNGIVKFTDISQEIAPALKNIGLVCDILVSDYDNDGWPDLILAGEWMPITILKNDHGKFSKVNLGPELENKLGWWNSIVSGDFRHTGRLDYIVGNLGENSLLQASDQYPIYITAKDFDNNGTYNAVPSLFLPDLEGIKREFPLNGRDDMLKEMISLKKKFPDYKSYAKAQIQDIFSPEQLKDAIRLKATYLKSSYVENLGNGKFKIIPLPIEAQFSSINGMQVGDFNGDGNQDLILIGNDYGTDLSIGRYDALNGLMLAGDGKGNFKPLPILESGIFLPGNGKALVQFRNKENQILLAASQNKDYLKVFQYKPKVNTEKINPEDSYAMIHYKNGTITKQEFYFGSSFLSQSSRFLQIDSNMKNIIVYDYLGKSRIIK